MQLRPAVLLVLMAGGCAAQRPSPDQSGGVSSQFAAYLRSEDYAKRIRGALDPIPSDVMTHCDALRVQMGKTFPMAAIEMGPNGTPVQGTWRQFVQTSGCGEEKIRSAYVGIGKSGEVTAIAAPAGSSLADLHLQRDAASGVLPAASARTGCKTTHLKDTRFEGTGQIGDPATSVADYKSGSPWWETWTLVGCGKQADVPVGFTPNDKGTAYFVNVSAIRVTDAP